MAISSDYSSPVMINGYMCRNCTDVAYAQRHIDPEHPKSGPFNVNAESDPTRQLEQALSANAQTQGAERVRGTDSSAPVAPTSKTVGTILDVRA